MGQSKEKDKHFGISDYLRRKICVLSIVEPSRSKPDTHCFLEIVIPSEP
jgi:hypothetical protein